MPTVTRSGHKRRFRKRTIRHGKSKVTRFGLQRALRRFSRRIPRPQRKYLDSAGQVIAQAASYTTIYSLATNGSLGATSSISQGTTQNEFIGFKGQWKSMMYRLALQANPQEIIDFGYYGQYIRFIFFWWKPQEYQPATGAITPLFNQILQNATSTPATATSYTYLSVYNKEWAKQYQIISDKTYALSTVGNTSTIIDKGYKKFSRTFQAFTPNAPAGGVNSLYNMVPYLLIVSNRNASADQPYAAIYTRMSYINF